MRFTKSMLLMVVFALCAATGLAQIKKAKDKTMKSKDKAMHKSMGTSSAALTGVKADTMFQLNEAARKLIALAEATPEDKYGWRPGEGVRSMSEVFMHVAGANYLFAGFVGSPLEGFEVPKSLGVMEKTTDKAKVVASLKKSFEHARMAIKNTKDADLGKEVTFFGNKSTYGGILVFMAVHCNEHLGQSIAYARINKITPPWSAARN